MDEEPEDRDEVARERFDRLEKMMHVAESKGISRGGRTLRGSFQSTLPQALPIDLAFATTVPAIDADQDNATQHGKFSYNTGINLVPTRRCYRQQNP